MKKLTLIFTLLFSTVMFSSPSYAEWTKVGSTGNGAGTFYVDFERIRKHGGYVYWWELTDLIKPDKDGDFSYKGYHQGDCKLFRVKYLSISYHKEPMGRGTGRVINPKNPKWDFPPPQSIGEGNLKTVCSR